MINSGSGNIDSPLQICRKDTTILKNVQFEANKNI